jgi:chemotaxis protein methyltransferase CheR
MTPASFEIFRRFLRGHAGLSIAVSRHDLLEARLLPVARRLGFETVDSLAGRIAGAPDDRLAASVIEAAVTSETLFFRDRAPFEQFRAILHHLRETRAESRQIRIWSAACSTGQEAYSLAMVLDEEARYFGGWAVEIVATDISAPNLKAAEMGFFNQFEVQRGLPVALLLRYFRQEGDRWRVSEHLRRRITFECFNLLDDPARLGTFDVIFCRNILIYFDVDARRIVFDRLRSALRPSGLITLGAAETTVGVTQSFGPHPSYPAFLAPAGEVAERRRPLKLVGARA